MLRSRTAPRRPRSAFSADPDSPGDASASEQFILLNISVGPTIPILWNCWPKVELCLCANRAKPVATAR